MTSNNNLDNALAWINLSGKVAHVTGGAKGIGKGIATALAMAGARVMISDVNLEGAKAVAAEIGGAAMALDVTDRAAVDEAMSRTAQELGSLDILVNNAGIAIRKSIFEMTMDEYQLQNSINLDGVFLGLKYGIPMIAKTEGGSVINLSSVAGLKASPGLSAYAMTKGGVRLLSKSVAKECIAEGIKVRVNSVHPGIIQTAIWDKMGVPTDGENQVDVEQLATNAVPGGLLGKPTDIADGVLFLASDESSYMTAQTLSINGGAWVH